MKLSSFIKSFTALALMLMIATGCDNSARLTDNMWIIQKASYLKQPITFSNKNPVFVSNDGTQGVVLGFLEDGSTTLPGIVGLPVRANWELKDDRLHYTIDSAYYKRLNRRLNKSWQDTNPLQDQSFDEIMKVFKNPFEYSYQGEYVILTSATTTLIAIRDGSVDRLFDGL